MSLFQKSVVKKYIKDLDTAFIDTKYAAFQSYFGNVDRQENIRNAKEEQFQEGFLRELFVNILGYTLNPEPDFNLTTELKNIANSKKADGAIMKGDDATAVIELKGTDTTDLDKVEPQAFGYKNHHPKCNYVIISNFEKLRFYIQNAVDHLDFNLFELTREQFSMLWLCLAKDNLLNDLPLKIKESSVLQEENITKKLYADYSKFREAIYKNLIKNNPETDKLLLFKKTQKLLDRFLFIFFAEDRLLLPPNSISEIVKQWKNLKDEYDEYFPLYARFKKYFGYMNTGYKGKKYEIYAYNGGLFKPDDILDNISIDDDILYEHTLRLSKYDFETDVDVNILGHIFEHSLGEIAAIAATAGHSSVSPQPAVSTRKKDGIFYTPKYITKYIVEHTVGKLCKEKRAELGIVDEEYAKGRKNRKKDIVRSLDKKLDDYRNWLLALTILDPACGSGAFLNQALEFLINEHRKIDELRSQLLGGAIIFSDITTDILEKNIYGVDLNEESVEIAKLSLWLRTAQKGRKLNTLSNNIKCGNSLIDDPEVAGAKAFNWPAEFPNIFQKKQKKAWHITTATHNSRYSQRMFDHHVKRGEPVWLSEKEERIVSETIATIAAEDKLNILAYNICGDHVHLLLVCEEEELPKIVQKIKSMSARACNIAMGRTIPETNREHAPEAERGKNSPTKEHAPLSGKRGNTQFHLWTQKFGQKEITSEEQLQNTIAYIRNNRSKHGLHTEGNWLSDINEKITCTRQHAFRPEYKGGFDVVIGNPPYVFGGNEGIGTNAKTYFKNRYTTGSGKVNLFTLFIEKSFNLLKQNGEFSFIIPNTFLRVTSYHESRKFFIENFQFRELADLGNGVFNGAVTTAIILIAKKTSPLKNDKIKIIKNFKGNFFALERQNIISNNYVITTNLTKEKQHILNKLKVDSFHLGNECKEMIFGVVISKNKDELVSDIKIDGYKPFIEGRDIGAYFIKPIHCYLDYNKEKLHRARTPEIFETNEKLLVQRITGGSKPLKVAYDDKKIYTKESINNIILHEKSFFHAKTILCILNSKLINWFYNNQFTNESTLTVNISKEYLSQIPIKKIETQQSFIEKANQMLLLNKKLQEKATRFINRLKTNFAIEKISTKLEKFYGYDFKTIVTELKKQKVKLTLIQQDEWEEYFDSYKTEINQLQSEIEKTDKEIDQMVYALYGLTEEEIRIVEESM